MGTPISGLTEMTALESNDAFPVAETFGASGGTKRISAANLLKAGGKVLFVDGTNGVDAKAARGSHLAYKTLTAAKNAAVSGDTIIVYPGTYDENDLLKDGVNWHFVTGSRVDFTNPHPHGVTAVPAIFDDNGLAVTSVISGDGDFHVNYGISEFDNDLVEPVVSNPNVHGVIFLDHEDTDLTVHFNKITQYGYFDVGKYAIWVKSCDRIVLRGEDIDDPSADATMDIGVGDPNGPYTLTSFNSSIYWELGEMFVDVKHIRAGGYAMYPQSPVGFTGVTNLWVESDLIESVNSPTIYINGDSATADLRVWVKTKELRQSIDGTVCNCLGTRYKLYLTALKIGGSAFNITGGETGSEVWISAQKYSVVPDATFASLTVNTGGVKVYANIQHWEDARAATTGVLKMVRVNGATSKLYLTGGTMVMKQNGIGIEHVLGSSVVSGLRIECNQTNDADNIPVIATGAGLVLDGCTLLAPALADSIYAATAQNVKVYGQTFANKAKHANVTIQVGTLTVDALVT